MLAAQESAGEGPTGRRKAGGLGGAPRRPEGSGDSGCAWSARGPRGPGRPRRKGIEFLQLGPQCRGLAAIFRATEDPARQTARQTAETVRVCRENRRTLKGILHEMKRGGGGGSRGSQARA